MSFGFSVGDVISCTKLAVNTYQALKSAPSEFHSLSLEVHSLSSTLKALVEEANSPYSILLSASAERQDSLKILLENLTNSLEKLRYLILRYSGLGDSGQRTFKERVMWTTKDKQGPRERLAVHVSSLNVFLTSLTHSSLGRLEALMRRAVPGSGGFDKGLSLGSIGAPDSEKDEFVKEWAKIAPKLFLLGMRMDDMRQFSDDISAYALYLSRGGKPFEISVGRQWQSAKPFSGSPVVPRIGKKKVDMRSRAEEDEEVRRKMIEESLKQKQARKSSDAEASLERRRREEELYAARKKHEAELQRKEHEEQRAKKKIVPPDAIVEAEPTKYFTDNSEIILDAATPPSLNDKDEADRLAKMFDQLFELDDHVPLGPSSSYSMDTYNPEAPYNPGAPASLPTPSPVPSPTSPDEGFGPLYPVAQKETVRAFEEVHVMPRQIIDAATKLHLRLRRLSLARLANDQHLVNDLTLHVIPEDVARLHELDINVMLCEACTLPIEDLYFSCEDCAQAWVCEDCRGKRMRWHWKACGDGRWPEERAKRDRNYWSCWIREAKEQDQKGQIIEPPDRIKHPDAPETRSYPKPAIK